MNARVEATGGWVRQERRRHGLSQAKLARLLGVPQAVVSQWELGKRPIADADAALVREILARLDELVRTGELTFKRRTRQHVNHIGSNGCPKRVAARPSEYVRLINEMDVTEEASAPVALSLFSGAGGLSLGLAWGGFRVAGYVELEASARQIYEANLGGVCLGRDVRQVTPSDVRSWRAQFGDVAVLAGGPPCQGFSLAGKRNVDDPRNRLFLDFARIAGILEPEVVILENIALMLSMRGPSGGPIAHDVAMAFESRGYECQFQVLNAQDYGVPQFRERVFFIACRSRPPSFPTPTHGPKAADGHEGSRLRSFRDATADLEPLEAGERSISDDLHWAVNHPAHVVDWLIDVPEGRSAHDNQDPANRPPSGYNTTYKRLVWEAPCSTVGTTFGMISASRNVHPQDTRSLTIREAARCQSFPDSFCFPGRKGAVRTAIGNAVPPLLGAVVAEHVRTTLLQSNHAETTLLK